MQLIEQNNQHQQKPQYISLFPFRFVRPYPYIYRTFAKGRWLNKPLLATMIKQFKAYPQSYYQQSITNGKIKVNGNIVSHDYVIKNGDQIIHESLRVEPPVLDLSIQIIQQNEDYLIINKPPSIIVHTGGGHHYNTIQNSLKYLYNYQNLFILHRLDKLTSGLLLLAKNKEKVSMFHQQSGKQIMKKMYLARVNGKIQWEQYQISAYIECLSHKDGIYKVSGLIQQYKQVQQKQIQNKNQEKNSKSSKTIFKKIWYDQKTDSSLVQCYPITGRTHQIRVHLQYLGHPILNDTVYGGRFVGNGIINKIKKNQVDEVDMGKPKKKVKLQNEDNIEQWDYKTKQWQIMLHSYKYKFEGKQYKSPLPYWSNKDQLGFKQ